MTTAWAPGSWANGAWKDGAWVGMLHDTGGRVEATAAVLYNLVAAVSTATVRPSLETVSGSLVSALATGRVAVNIEVIGRVEVS